MTSVALLELLISVSIQASLIVVVSDAVVRLSGRKVRGDLLWFCGHLAVVTIVLSAFTLPHLRLLVASPIFLKPLSHVFESHSLSVAIVTIWFAGVLLSLFTLIISTCQLYGELRRSHPAPDSLLSKLDSPKIGTKPIQILVSPTSNGPFCWQVHRPTIVLPAFIVEWPSGTLEAVVRHELAHLRARHPLHLFCQRIIECFFWFHPVVWYGSYAAVAHREFYCDEICVSAHGDAVTYLRSLLWLVENGTTLPSGLATGAAFTGSQSLVQQRAKRIFEWSQHLSSRSRPPASGGILVALTLPICLCVVVAMAIWIPLNPMASHRSIWSPWPRVSAEVLQTFGITVIDYEVDGYRLRHHVHQ